MTRQSMGARLENTQEVQLLCTCCGQAYYPTKSWQDKLQAVFLGAEKYAICPVCTQRPPDDVFADPNYRRRCRRNVERLQILYELSRKNTDSKTFANDSDWVLGGCVTEIKILHRKGRFAVSVDGEYQDVKSEADVLTKLAELGITRDRAEAAIATLKQKGEVSV